MESRPTPELAALRARTTALLERAVRHFERVGDRFEIPYQSTRVVVHPLDWTDGRTLLRFLAPLVVEAPTSSALHRRLGDLNHGTIFGKFYLHEGTVFVEHYLLGESVDEPSFRAALASVAHHADYLGEALAAEFGGHAWTGAG